MSALRTRPADAPTKDDIRSSRSSRLTAYIPRSWEDSLYLAGVAVGSVLIVIACVNQPYNQNEIQQIAPYGDNDLGKIIDATRQPPLDPVLGAIVQHLLGVGQLRQRIVPGLAGIITLVVLALLLRRLKTGAAGVVALWVVATTPLLIRYSAYSRPYALPMMLMVCYVYAAEQFAATRSKIWLAVLAVVAAAMPASRVPEPDVFLVAVLAVTGWRLWRGRVERAVGIPLLVVPFLAFALVGYPLYRVLKSETEGVFDPSPGGIIDRFPQGVHEIFHGFLPLISHYVPWWPLCILVAVAAVAIPRSRNLLLEWWFVWPLLAAPLAFVFAYHFMNPYPFAVRPYRIRMALFFIPPFTFVVAAAVAGVIDLAKTYGRWVQVGVAGLLAAFLVTQLPATAEVVTENEAPDYGQVADVLTEQIPDNAIVMYDAISSPGQWRQPFSARPRYMKSVPYVSAVEKIPESARTFPRQGPLYVLLLDSPCATSVVCDGPRVAWDRHVDGWRVVARFDRFTLYQSTAGLSGREDAITALQDWASDIGYEYAYPEIFAAAGLLKVSGRSEEGRQLIDDMYNELDPGTVERIQVRAKRHNLNPFHLR